MRISKAVITAAGQDQNHLPLQRLVDRNGHDKSALELIVEEAASTGVKDICIVIQPGDSNAYQNAAGRYAEQLTFVEQKKPRGYGDALSRAQDFTQGEPFLHLVGDHLYLSHSKKTCAQQLIEIASTESCAVSAVQPTRENKLPYFGTVGGNRVGTRNDLYEVSHVIEKPTPTVAEQELIVAGLRAGYYLCMFGMHVFTPTVHDILNELVSRDQTDPIQLTSALAELAVRERYLAAEINGGRHNIGVKYGLLMAQISLALTGHDRDYILTELVELLSTKPEADSSP